MLHLMSVYFFAIAGAMIRFHSSANVVPLRIGICHFTNIDNPFGFVGSCFVHPLFRNLKRGNKYSAVNVITSSEKRTSSSLKQYSLRNCALLFLFPCSLQARSDLTSSLNSSSSESPDEQCSRSCSPPVVLVPLSIFMNNDNVQFEVDTI